MYHKIHPFKEYEIQWFLVCSYSYATITPINLGSMHTHYQVTVAPHLPPSATTLGNHLPIF